MPVATLGTKRDGGRIKRSVYARFAERDQGEAEWQSRSTEYLNYQLDHLPKPEVVITSRATSSAMAAIYSMDLEREDESLSSHTQRSNFSSKSEESYTLLDPKQLEATQSTFRGIFYLHWLSMIAVALSILIHNYRTKEGMLLGSNLYHVITTDMPAFIAAECAMVLSLFLFPLVQMGILSGYISLRTIVFLLHTITMIMKIYSYSFTNELLHKKWKRSVQVDKAKTHKRKLSNGLEYESEGLLDDCVLIHGPLQYPNNVTLSNFLLYLVIPSLVYQLNFPKTSKVRWSMLIEKTFSALLSFLLMYMIVEHWIQPILFDVHTMSLSMTIVELIFPFTVFYILGFYIVFECLCNWCSEITRYGSRSFYDDWWNSVTFDQFARKWNKPVHQFLYHHVYEHCLKSYGYSKSSATIFTFFFSSCLHEFVLFVVCRRVKFVFFALQMLQIPLIYLGKFPIVKRHPLYCNLFFWLAMIVGPPLLAVLYSRDHFLASDPKGDFVSCGQGAL